MSPIVVTEDEAKALTPDVTIAINRLAAKEKQLVEKAVRHPVGSNGRKVALGMAEHIRACARLLIAEPSYQMTLLAEDLLDGGWKPMCVRIGELWRAAEIERQEQRDALKVKTDEAIAKAREVNL